MGIKNSLTSAYTTTRIKCLHSFLEAWRSVWHLHVLPHREFDAFETAPRPAPPAPRRRREEGGEERGEEAARGAGEEAAQEAAPAGGTLPVPVPVE